MTPSRSSGSIRSRLGVAVHPRRGRASRSGARHDPSAWAQSGMRAGEVCGLQWGDLGLDRGEALVQRTRSRRASARRRRGGRGWSHSSTRSRTTLPNGAQGPQRPARRALGGAAGVQGAESCSGDVRVRFRSAPAGFDGAPPGAASRADGREGALQGRGAPQAHVGQRDALAQRPPALRPAIRAQPSATGPLLQLFGDPSDAKRGPRKFRAQGKERVSSLEFPGSHDRSGVAYTDAAARPRTRASARQRQRGVPRPGDLALIL
jgi:hypothetical protein